MKMKIVKGDFTVCKLENESQIRFEDEFVFTAKTDEEISLVCKTKSVPTNCISAEHGWNLIKVDELLEFSMTGILAEITGILAKNKISVFAISTFNTDYILLKKVDLVDAISALTEHEYQFV